MISVNILKALAHQKKLSFLFQKSLGAKEILHWNLILSLTPQRDYETDDYMKLIERVSETDQNFIEKTKFGFVG